MVAGSGLGPSALTTLPAHAASNRFTLPCYGFGPRHLADHVARRDPRPLAAQVLVVSHSLNCPNCLSLWSGGIGWGKPRRACRRVSYAIRSLPHSDPLIAGNSLAQNGRNFGNKLQAQVAKTCTEPGQLSPPFQIACRICGILHGQNQQSIQPPSGTHRGQR